MNEKKDLIGMTFGRLKVIENVSDRNKGGKVSYRCLCKCGNERIVSERNLVTGHIKSCGCLRSSNIIPEEVIGKKFGEFTIIKFDKINNRNVRKYICRCSCGKEVSVNIYNLLTGKSTNCGCQRKNNLSKIKRDDLIGKKFGKLTVVELVKKNKNQKLLYKCLCDCGGTCMATTQSLKSGHTTSCGCIQSLGNMLLERAIKTFKIPYVREYHVNLENEVVKYIRFDMFLPTLNIAIEFDGEQHFRPIKHFGGKKGFLKTQMRDKIKNNYCMLNNIKLIRIPYYEKNNIINILQNNLSPTTTERNRLTLNK